MKIVPFDKVVIVEEVKVKSNTFDMGEKDIDVFIIKDKGENCRNNYKIGDKIFTISGEAYKCENFTFVHDDSILGKIEE